MNAAIKAKWVAALRSGEYQQGAGRLCDGTAFCCLGVLANLYIEETGDGCWNNATQYVFKDKDGFVEGTELPSAVMIWADLDIASPYVSTPHAQHDLITMNDAGVPFSKIADIIEEYL